MSEDGRDVYAIRVEDGLIGIIYAGGAIRDERTTSERVQEVLEAVLNEGDYVFGAIVEFEKGYVIARQLNEPHDL